MYFFTTVTGVEFLPTPVSPSEYIARTRFQNESRRSQEYLPQATILKSDSRLKERSEGEAAAVHESKNVLTIAEI